MNGAKLKFFLWFIWELFSLYSSDMNNMVGFGVFVFFSFIHFIIYSLISISPCCGQMQIVQLVSCPLKAREINIFVKCSTQTDSFFFF